MLPSISRASTALAALSLSFGLAGASPMSEAATNQALATRGPAEALYLVNCQFAQNGKNTNQQSQMAYYSNGKSGSQHGEQPNDVAQFQSVVIWEGRPQTAKFQNSGASATSNIRSDASNYSPGTAAGTARNSFGQNFNCFKDNYRVLYTTSNNQGISATCYSIYYCFDA